MLGKSRIKSVIYGFEVRSTAIIGNGLTHSVPKQKVLKEIRRELVRLQKYANLTSSETNELWQESYGRYMRVSKKVFSSLRRAENDLKIRADTDLEYDERLKNRKNTVYKELKGEHTKNELANEYEYRGKREYLQNLTNSGVFYLCSTHINPAKDHADWEGKVYIASDWRSRIDADMHGKIEAYVRNHNVKTVEWVTGEPVYLITRPNCKHYFIEVSVEEVLGNSVRKLLKTHNMYMEDEKEMSYEEGQYKNYYERLKMLTYLNSMFDAENLDKDIKDTRALVNKWKLLSEGSGYRTRRGDRANPSRDAA